MKIVVEVENDEEMIKVGKFLKFLDPSIIRKRSIERDSIKRFMDFIDHEATPVEKILIPNREERNAR